jgi:hypothetical protein
MHRRHPRRPDTAAAGSAAGIRRGRGGVSIHRRQIQGIGIYANRAQRFNPIRVYLGRVLARVNFLFMARALLAVRIKAAAGRCASDSFPAIRRRPTISAFNVSISMRCLWTSRSSSAMRSVSGHVVLLFFLSRLSRHEIGKSVSSYRLYRCNPGVTGGLSI